MKKILITGGCGFIGSHLTEYFFNKYKKAQIVVYDKISYAAHINNLKSIIKSKRLKIIKRKTLIFSYAQNSRLFQYISTNKLHLHVDVYCIYT